MPTTYTDNFNRANEYPLTTNWERIFRKIGDFGEQLFWSLPNLVNQQVENREGSVFKFAAYTGTKFQTNQAITVQVTIARTSQFDPGGFGLLIGLDSGTGTGYFAQLSYSRCADLKSRWTLFNCLDVTVTCSPLSSTCLISTVAEDGIKYAQGDKISFVFDGGNTWTIKHGDTTKLSVSDSSVALAGSVGFGVFAFGDTAPDGRPLWQAIDDFQVIGEPVPNPTRTLAPNLCVCSGRYA